jgi:sigma-B regulation protein RsbU (phosphoserine phosphatase)
LDYFNKSHNVLQLTYAGVQSGNLKLNDFEGLRRYFWQTVHDGKLESYLSYRNEQGEFVGVEHQKNGTVQLKIPTLATAPIWET